MRTSSQHNSEIDRSPHEVYTLVVVVMLIKLDENDGTIDANDGTIDATEAGEVVGCTYN